jgi:hypothetical protein
MAHGARRSSSERSFAARSKSGGVGLTGVVIAHGAIGFLCPQRLFFERPVLKPRAEQEEVAHEVGDAEADFHERATIERRRRTS